MTGAGAEASTYWCIEHLSETPKRRRTTMRDPKDKSIPRKSDQGAKTAAEEYRERLDREDMERRWNLEALDCILAECEECPEKFHQYWIKPLLSAGVSLETAFALLVGGRFRPN
jgi:hypothetical protein